MPLRMHLINSFRSVGDSECYCVGFCLGLSALSGSLYEDIVLSDPFFFS